MLFYNINVCFNIKIAFLPLKLHVKVIFQKDASFLAVVSSPTPGQWATLGDIHPGVGQAGLAESPMALLVLTCTWLNRELVNIQILTLSYLRGKRSHLWCGPSYSHTQLQLAVPQEGSQLIPHQHKVGCQWP